MTKSAFATREEAIALALFCANAIGADGFIDSDDRTFRDDIRAWIDLAAAADRYRISADDIRKGLAAHARRSIFTVAYDCEEPDRAYVEQGFSGALLAEYGPPAFFEAASVLLGTGREDVE